VPGVNSKTQAPNHKPARPAGGKISNTKNKKPKTTSFIQTLNIQTLNLKQP
jgi:hypothetical protein